MLQLLERAHRFFEKIKFLDFLAPFLIRLYLAPIFIIAGLHKFKHFDDIVSWFTHMGFPMPELMTLLAASAEFLGGMALLFGIATRLSSIPLMITMLVAIFAVHWKDGWFAIAPGNPETSPAYVLQWIGFPGAKESLLNSEAVNERLSKARSILKQHGNYNWLTEKGSFVILNNGIEFASTYFLMLLVLFFFGAGNFVSIDYWFKRFWQHKISTLQAQ